MSNVDERFEALLDAMLNKEPLDHSGDSQDKDDDLREEQDD